MTLKHDDISNQEYSNQFQGMRVLVTGGAGFIGSHVTEHLVSSGADVLVLDDMSKGSVENLSSIRDRIRLHEGSVIDRGLVSNLLKEHEPEIVFHLAARNLVLSIENPQLDVEVSIIGLLNLIEEIRKSEHTKVFVHSSSGSVYGEPLEFPQTETHIRSPTSPYGIAKMAAEEYLRVWNDLYNLQYISLRYYNVYGPRQSSEEDTGGGVIPIFANRLLSGLPLIIDGSGKQERCFTYVTDVVRSNLLAAVNKECWCDNYNIATTERTNIITLAKLMMETAEVETPVEFGPARLGEVMKFYPSVELAVRKMGYSPRVTLRDGLPIYFEWLRSNGF